MSKDERELELGPEPQREGPDPMETLVVPLWRAKFSIAFAAAVGVGAGALYSATLPNTYESVGKLLARSGAREQGSAEARVSGSLSGSSFDGREAVSNELHLLSNPRIFESVAREIGPARILAPYDPASEDMERGFALRALHSFQSAWFKFLATRSGGDEHALDGCDACVSAATAMLMHDLWLRAEPGSSVLTVTCRSSSPRLSAELVDAFIAQALAHHQSVFSSDSSLAFLDDQVESAQSASAAAKTQLVEYRVECGFYDPETQRQQLLTDLHSVEAQLGDDGARIATLEALIGALEEELAAQAERETLPVASPVVVNPAYTRLQERLSDLQNSLIALDTRRDLTPRGVELERASLGKQLEGARSELEQTSEFLAGSGAVQDVPNPRRAVLRERIDDAREEWIALLSGTSVREQRLERMRQALVDLERCSSMMDQFVLAVRQSDGRLEQFLDAREKVGVMDLLDRVNLINLRPLQSGTVPFHKSGPRRGRSVILGGLLGLAAGLALALVRPSFTRRLRSGDDVARVLAARSSP